MATINRKEIRQRIHKRIRKTISGTAERPRLAVHLSNKRIYTQIIDDEQQRTLVSASTMEKALESRVVNIANATKVGEALAERALSAGITKVVFDRGGHHYHGRVKAVADAARAKGLQF